MPNEGQEILDALKPLLERDRWQQLQAWHPAHWGQLGSAQRRILQKLSDILIIDLGPYHKRTYQEMQQLDKAEREYLVKATAAYEKSMLKPIRLGLQEHPLVREWWETRHSLGARRVLRRAKIGLERGVRSLLNRPNKNTALEAEIRRLRENGQNINQIYDTLTRQGRLPKQKLPTFEKWCRRRGLHQLPAINQDVSPERPSLQYREDTKLTSAAWGRVHLAGGYPPDEQA
jgi:hypothetical protein